MPGPDEVRFRTGGPGDAAAIAALHADSWRRHYRIAYSDHFLDDEAGQYLLDLWTGRFTGGGDPARRTVLAEQNGRLVGLAHTVLDEHPAWGALLDNLHVVHNRKRQGLGTCLLARTAATVLAERPGSGLQLWVLEKNTAARAFYDARGGKCVESRDILPPGGDPSRLVSGRPQGLRYHWPDPAVLV
jgi:ribosomal protein S18 acetylase RimI-like enzyme